jgi:hypothetical protein
VREPGMHPEDSYWAGKYLALLDAFCAAYRREPDIAAFRRRQEESMPAHAAA